MNKRGALNEMIGMATLLVVIIVVSLIAVVFSAVIIYGFGIITKATTTQQLANNAAANITQYSETTFGNINAGIQQLRWISFVLIFGMIVGIFIGNFLVKVHPGYFGLYVLISVAVIVFSIYISNAYEALYLSGGPLGNTLKSFVGTSWLLLYLPAWITVVAFIGAIFLFTGMNRDPEQGGFI